MGLQTPPKPPYRQNADGEVIGSLGKESLPYVEPEDRPPPKPPRIQTMLKRGYGPLLSPLI